MDETVWVPVVLSVEIAPNPATTGAPVLIRVSAVDIFGVEQVEARLAGEFYCGEV